MAKIEDTMITIATKHLTLWLLACPCVTFKALTQNSQLNSTFLPEHPHPPLSLTALSQLTTSGGPCTILSKAFPKLVK